MNVFKLMSYVMVLSMLVVSQSSASNAEIKAKAKKSIMIVGGALKKNLLKKIEKEGMVAAAKFCSLSAVPLVKKVSKTLDKGVSVRRITSKPRNHANKANAKEMIVLNEFADKKKKNKMPKMIVKKLSDNHYQVYKPMLMGGVCLQCHGEKSVIDKEAYKEISKHYPNDKAIGYKADDLRGAFLVDIVQ